MSKIARAFGGYPVVRYEEATIYVRAEQMHTQGLNFVASALLVHTIVSAASRSSTAADVGQQDAVFRAPYCCVLRAEIEKRSDRDDKSLTNGERTSTVERQQCQWHRGTGTGTGRRHRVISDRKGVARPTTWPHAPRPAAGCTHVDRVENWASTWKMRCKHVHVSCRSSRLSPVCRASSSSSQQPLPLLPQLSPVIAECQLWNR